MDLHGSKRCGDVLAGILVDRQRSIGKMTTPGAHGVWHAVERFAPRCASHFILTK